MKQLLQKFSFFYKELSGFQTKKCFIFIFLNLFWLSGNSQNNQQHVEKKTFNLPPGVVLLPKTDTNINYSYKLSQIPNIEPKNIVEIDFFKDIPKEKLNYMEEKAPNDFQYYIKARDYYNTLSKKVKVTFTVEELWYIYYFDQKLKSTLQTIK